MGTWPLKGFLKRVEYTAEVEQDILSASELHDGAEIGGVLWGTWEGSFARIESCQLFWAAQCPLEFTENEHQGLVALLDTSSRGPGLEHLEPLGWYRCSSQPAPGVRSAELSLYDRYFPAQWQILVVAIPNASGESTIRIFDRNEQGELVTEPPFTVLGEATAQRTGRGEEHGDSTDVEDVRLFTTVIDQKHLRCGRLRRRKRLLAAGLAAVGFLSAASVLAPPSAWTGAITAHWERIHHAPQVSDAAVVKAPVTVYVSELEPARQFDWTADDPSPAQEVTRRILTIQWETDEELVSRAISARLVIQDGTRRSEVPVDLGRLAQGSRTYVPDSMGVDIQLLISFEEGDPTLARAKFSPVSAPSQP